MDELTPPPTPAGSPEAEPASALPPRQQPLEESVTRAFVGPNGIRAGWRVLIFFSIWFGLLVVGGAIIAIFSRRLANLNEITPGAILFSDGLQFACALLAAWIMTFIEGRKLSDYGLPLRGAFGAKFWQGTVFGFASITVLLAVLRACRVFYFGNIGLHGAELAKYAALWGLAFLLVSFFEEYFVRGYPLFTLTIGISFWPAAVVLSILFGLWHFTNPGENWAGILGVSGSGFLFCVIIRKTGDLWMAIGFHAAWDWAETYFYGVADSGLVAPGHLFNSKLAGPVWLTGGSAGPEGSWLCLILLAILCIVFAVWMPEAKYPNPDAIRDPRKKEPPLSLFSAAPDQTPPVQG